MEETEPTTGAIERFLSQKEEVKGFKKKLDKLSILYTVCGEWLFNLRKEDERK